MNALPKSNVSIIGLVPPVGNDSHGAAAADASASKKWKRVRINTHMLWWALAIECSIIGCALWSNILFANANGDTWSGWQAMLVGGLILALAEVTRIWLAK